MMILKKMSACSIILLLLLFSGCNEEIKDYQYNGKKNYSGTAESLSLSVKSEQELDNIRDAAITSDNEKIYVIGSEKNKDEYFLKTLDFKTEKSVPVNINFDYSNISDGAIIGDDLYLLYQDRNNETHISRIDKSGNIVNDCSLDIEIAQNISLSEDYCYCFSINELYDGSLNFKLDIFDRTLQKVNTVDLNELLMLKDNEGVADVVCDLNDNLYLQIVLPDENNEHINGVRIVKLAQNLREIYQISELSGMIGDTYKIYPDAKGNLCVGSYDENGIIYENIYASSDGRLLSMYEKQVKADEWMLDAENSNISYRINNEWYRYHPADDVDYQLSVSDNDEENYERVLFDNGSSAVLLYRKNGTSELKINIYDGKGNLADKKRIETDSDFIGMIAGTCICDNKIYALFNDGTGDKIFVYDLKSDSAVWYDANSIDDNIYRIIDVEADENSVVFLAQYLNTSQDKIYNRIISCSPDDILNILSVSEYNTAEHWDELVKDADGSIFAFKTYPDKTFMKISNGETVTGFEKKASDNIGLYTVDGTSLYGYNMKKRTVSSKPLNLLLSSCAVLENNNIVCLANDFSTMKSKLLFVTDSDESKRNIIRVLCPKIISPDISKATDAFNKSHDNDVIELNEFSYDRINDVITGTDSFDIIISTDSALLQQYALNGTLCSLNEYIREDTTINPEDFIVPDIHNDNIFYVYPEFSVSVYTYNKNHTDIQNLSNITEMVTMIDKTNMSVVEKNKETEFFVNIIEDNISKWVNYQNKSCDFGNALFDDIADLMDKQKNSDHDAENNLISHDNICDLDMFASIISKSYMINCFNEEKSDAFIKPEYFIALCEDSQNKNAAWDFIKSTLNDDYQNNTRAFPVKKSVYNNHRYIGKDQKVMDEFLSVLSRSNPICYPEPELSSLINEHIDMYLNNIISREELKSSLNSKVSLYLNEKY